MNKRNFLVTISTEADEFNESEFSVKEAIENAIENEVQDNYESPIFDCGFSVKNEILENGHFGFGNVIQFLKEGKACRRSGWNGKGMFIIKQVPSHIGGDIIPKMQSLPQAAKDILMSRDNPHIDYTNQMLIINPNGRADSWVPSSSDIFAEDWEVVDE